MALSFKKQAASRSHIKRLMASWSKNTIKIKKLSQKCADTHEKVWVKPSLSRKLMDLIDQIAVFRNKELEIISEINAIEQKHRFLREHKKLKKPNLHQNYAYFSKKHHSPKARRSRFWMVVFWLWLLSDDNNNNKKQKLSLS